MHIQTAIPCSRSPALRSPKLSEDKIRSGYAHVIERPECCRAFVCSRSAPGWPVVMALRSPLPARSLLVILSSCQGACPNKAQDFWVVVRSSHGECGETSAMPASPSAVCSAKGVDGACVMDSMKTMRITPKYSAPAMNQTKLWFEL